LKLDIDSKAPDFTLESADGKKVSISDFKGK
jgi:peroxiredoxin